MRLLIDRTVRLALLDRERSSSPVEDKGADEEKGVPASVREDEAELEVRELELSSGSDDAEDCLEAAEEAEVGMAVVALNAIVLLAVELALIVLGILFFSTRSSRSGERLSPTKSRL